MTSGLLSLKWNNHSSTFLTLLESLRNKESFTDATLACEGKLYPVHKFVLSICSDYFQKIFEDERHCKQFVVVLKDISCNEIEALLSYMYVGEVNVMQERLPGLLKAAECLRIKGLAVPDDNCTTSTQEKRPAAEKYSSARMPAQKRIKLSTDCARMCLRRESTDSSKSENISICAENSVSNNLDGVSKKDGCGLLKTSKQLVAMSHSNVKRKCSMPRGATASNETMRKSACEVKLEAGSVEDAVKSDPEEGCTEDAPDQEDADMRWSSATFPGAEVPEGINTETGVTTTAAANVADADVSSEMSSSTTLMPELEQSSTSTEVQPVMPSQHYLLTPALDLGNALAPMGEYSSAANFPSHQPTCLIDAPPSFSGQLQDILESGPVGDFAEYVESIRGQRKLVNHNYIYLKDAKSKQGVTYWHCEVRGCKARARTDPLDPEANAEDSNCASDPIRWGQEKAVVTVTQEHNHEPDVNKAEGLRKNMVIKNHFRLAGVNVQY